MDLQARKGSRFSMVSEDRTGETPSGLESLREERARVLNEANLSVTFGVIVPSRYVSGRTSIPGNQGFAMLKAVIFDLDGTIIDSEPLHTEAVLRIFREHSITLGKGDLDKYIGISSTVMWGEMRKNHGLAESIEYLKAWQHKLNLELLNTAGSIMMPGVPELLENLRRHGIAMAIASSSARDYITAVVAEYGLAGYFSHLVSGEEVPRGKPRPDIFLKTAELLGASPSDCVVIEDSDNGLNAACEAGIRAVGIRNSNSGNQSLALAGRVVKCIPEITIELLKELVDPAPAA